MVEIIMALTALGIVVLTIAQFSQVFLRATRLVSERTQAAFLAQEAVEGVRHLRDASWTNNIAPLASGTLYYVAFASTTPAYSLTTAAQPLLLGRFDRTVTPYTVSRDANDDIAQSGGTADTSTMRFVVDVSWRQYGATTTENIEFYLADLFEN
jgi:Tfp pilus assembly protein PilV